MLVHTNELAAVKVGRLQSGKKAGFVPPQARGQIPRAKFFFSISSDKWWLGRNLFLQWRPTRHRLSGPIALATI